MTTSYLVQSNLLIAFYLGHGHGMLHIQLTCGSQSNIHQPLLVNALASHLSVQPNCFWNKRPTNDTSRHSTGVWDWTGNHQGSACVGEHTWLLLSRASPVASYHMARRGNIHCMLLFALYVALKNNHTHHSTSLKKLYLSIQTCW